MRTTLTLDRDVAERLNAEVKRTDRAFKQVVNEALRRGLEITNSTAKRPVYKVRPLSMKLRPGIDPDKLNDLADELEIEEQVRTLRK